MMSGSPHMTGFFISGASGYTGTRGGFRIRRARVLCRIGESGERVLLIGRGALVALGLLVLTADYDFWIHPEDVALFNIPILSEISAPGSRHSRDSRASGRARKPGASRWGMARPSPAIERSRELVRWFRRRYSTAASRLAYARGPTRAGHATAGHARVGVP